MVRRKKSLVLGISFLIAFSLVLPALPLKAEQPVRPEMQPWFNPAAEVFTNPDVLQDPNLFSRSGLEALWSGVHGGTIGPDCPLLLCATHPLGLALITGGLIRNPNEQETLRLAEILMAMGAAYGNRYGRGIPLDSLDAWHSQVAALCQILALRADMQDRQGGRRMTIYCDMIDPNVPLYTDELVEFSLIRRCLEQCPCASLPQAGPNGDAGEPPPAPVTDLPPGQPPFKPVDQPPTTATPKPTDPQGLVKPNPTLQEPEKVTPLIPIIPADVITQPPVVPVIPEEAVPPPPIYQIIPGVLPVTPIPDIEQDHRTPGP